MSTWSLHVSNAQTLDREGDPVEVWKDGSAGPVAEVGGCCGMVGLSIGR